MNRAVFICVCDYIERRKDGRIVRACCGKGSFFQVGCRLLVACRLACGVRGGMDRTVKKIFCGDILIFARVDEILFLMINVSRSIIFILSRIIYSV